MIKIELWFVYNDEKWFLKSWAWKQIEKLISHVSCVAWNMDETTVIK